MGESEGDYRKRIILSEYKDYMRQQQDHNAYTLEPKASMGDFQQYQGSPGGMSKRQTIYLQKKIEAESRPIYQEPNIYATKQRYKYSLQGKPGMTSSGANLL